MMRRPSSGTGTDPSLALCEPPPMLAEFGLAQALGCAPNAALARLSRIARGGLAEAQVALGQYLLYGHGLPADPVRAVAWFRIAAAAGHAPGMNMLGRCLERGWGLGQDPVAAVGWYTRAAGLGLDWAQYNLGNATMRGRGTALNRIDAYGWFCRAAEQGHAKSMNLVGRFLEEGWNLHPDPVAALEWYRRSAEGGDYRGQFNWGTCLMRQGCMEEAARWFLLAASQATPDLLPIMAATLGADPAYAVAATLVRSRMIPSPGPAEKPTGLQTVRRYS